MNHSSGEAGSDGVLGNDKSTPKDAQARNGILTFFVPHIFLFKRGCYFNPLARLKGSKGTT